MAGKFPCRRIIGLFCVVDSLCIKPCSGRRNRSPSDKIRSHMDFGRDKGRPKVRRKDGQRQHFGNDRKFVIFHEFVLFIVFSRSLFQLHTGNSRVLINNSYFEVYLSRMKYFGCSMIFGIFSRSISNFSPTPMTLSSLARLRALSSL